MRVAYFVHDLSDAAVAKRIAMLRTAGAEVVVLGFRRTAQPTREVAGAPAIDLGRTADARLLARAVSVAANLVKAPWWKSVLAGVDVVIARNLEMLVLAASARALHAPGARMVYECLDIHRMMLGSGPISRALRRIEAKLLARCDVLMVSSPAFVEHYFEPVQKTAAMPGLTTLLVENKVFLPDGAPARPSRPPPGRPWRIGWFGMIRCRRSFDALTALAERRPDLVEIVIRGRPSYTEFEDFDARVAAVPNVRFGGRYTPEELPAMYGDIHFNWSIDYFQEEGNSRWLLPNRLYEGGLHGAPIITRGDCEVARWLEGRGLGLVFDRPETALEAFLDGLDDQAYARIAGAHAEAAIEDFVAGPADCLALAAALGGEETAGAQAASPAAAASSRKLAQARVG